jgi:hypothetical protein
MIQMVYTLVYFLLHALLIKPKWYVPKFYEKFSFVPFNKFIVECGGADLNLYVDFCTVSSLAYNINNDNLFDASTSHIICTVNSVYKNNQPIYSKYFSREEYF